MFPIPLRFRQTGGLNRRHHERRSVARYCVLCPFLFQRQSGYCRTSGNRGEQFEHCARLL
jgi:hypothetical protein